MRILSPILGLRGSGMKAIVLSKYGSFDALELREVDAPEPGADEVV